MGRLMMFAWFYGQSGGALPAHARRRLETLPEFHRRCGLDDAAAVLPDLQIDQLTAVRLEAFECAFLVRSHQPRIACHIGGNDRGETAFDGLLHSLSLPRGS